MIKMITETAEFIKAKVKTVPEIAIILGTGLGELVDHIVKEVTIPYETIPNFPVSTVEGHSGKLIFGQLNGVYIMAMQGRFHYYEGYSMQQVTFPIRVMQALGIKSLFLSNASGGMNPDFKVGDLMLITDHINCFPEHPLRGRNDERLGVRFPDMSEVYSKRFITIAEGVAKECGIKYKKGVYVGTQGPTFETPAEYNYFRVIGGDAVGMSTVPEVIVAKHAGLEVFGISVITDMALVGHVEVVSHELVQKAAAEAQPKMTMIISGIISKLKN